MATFARSASPLDEPASITYDAGVPPQSGAVHRSVTEPPDTDAVKPVVAPGAPELQIHVWSVGCVFDPPPNSTTSLHPSSVVIAMPWRAEGLAVEDLCVQVTPFQLHVSPTSGDVN